MVKPSDLIKVVFKVVDTPLREGVGYYNQYKVKVIYKNKSRTFDYGDSVHNYQQGIEPNKKDLLECLCSDYTSNTDSFTDFCSEFGYDPDSRKVEKIFNDIIKEKQKLNDLFGMDFIEKMMREFDTDDDQVEETKTKEELNKEWIEKTKAEILSEVKKK